MGSKLSSKALRILEALEEARRKWDRVHSLVEKVAGARTGQDMYLSQISRAAAHVNRLFMSNGLGPLADTANQLSMLVRRGGTMQSKVRSMREMVVSVRAGMERAKKAVLTADAQASREGVGSGERGDRGCHSEGAKRPKNLSAGLEILRFAQDDK